MCHTIIDIRRRPVNYPPITPDGALFTGYAAPLGN